MKKNANISEFECHMNFLLQENEIVEWIENCPRIEARTTSEYTPNNRVAYEVVYTEDWHTSDTPDPTQENETAVPLAAAAASNETAAEEMRVAWRLGSHPILEARTTSSPLAVCAPVTKNISYMNVCDDDEGDESDDDCWLNEYLKRKAAQPCTTLAQQPHNLLPCTNAGASGKTFEVATFPETQSDDIAPVNSDAPQTTGVEGHLVTQQMSKKRKPSSRAPSGRENNKLQKKNCTDDAVSKVNF